MSAKQLKKYARPDEAGAERLARAIKTFNLSARAYERIRNLDRSDWTERCLPIK